MVFFSNKHARWRERKRLKVGSLVTFELKMMHSGGCLFFLSKMRGGERGSDRPPTVDWLLELKYRVRVEVVFLFHQKCEEGEEAT